MNNSHPLLLEVSRSRNAQIQAGPKIGQFRSFDIPFLRAASPFSSIFVSSVRSSNSHPDLLVIQHPTHFFRSHRSSTLDFHFLSHYSYRKAIMLYKDNHWTQCAGFMDASWVRLGINNDDLGTSWALPGDNLGMTWG